MTLWQILVVIAIIVIPLILSIWMTLWTVEKRGRGPTPYKRPEPAPPAERDSPRPGETPADPPARRE